MSILKQILCIIAVAFPAAAEWLSFFSFLSTPGQLCGPLICVPSFSYLVWPSVVTMRYAMDTRI